VRRLFRELWSNEDSGRYRVALDVLDGRHTWLEAGILGLEDQAAAASAPAARAKERDRVAVSA
jgi:hypothetical protein